MDVNVTVVGPEGVLTTCGAPLLVPLLLVQSPTPVNAAVSTWLPAVSAEVVKDARPVASTLTLEAHTVAPSVNVTLPRGVPEGEVTVAVKVTGCPSVDGFGDDVSVVVVVTSAPDGLAESSFERAPSPPALVPLTT